MLTQRARPFLFSTSHPPAVVAACRALGVRRLAALSPYTDELNARMAEERGADLIVVGNKGMTGARRFLLGSVPNKISHHAPCSVLIIRTT